MTATALGVAALALTVPLLSVTGNDPGAPTTSPVARALVDAEAIAEHRETVERQWTDAVREHAVERHAVIAHADAADHREAEEARAAEEAEEARAAEEAERAADRSASRQVVPAVAASAPTGTAGAVPTGVSTDSTGYKVYTDDLDGWILEALDIMSFHGIPGSYDGLHRNIMRESSGNPNAINLWDINAQNGTPSIGLLQVIQPTFDAYHVPGTPHDLYDPVANLVAAANYAAHRYGSIDNVNGPY
ncbi:transglycosylase SLT domain-containing protein [Streptomyces sp. ST2-7A]|nr:transglycosylase SLT domain-containing protein [Streptomyces sp. ST2-7A]MCE7083156.1 transglycosylase SLT domain-containing protein [Streptomyces sp. ST2-7A]